MTRQVEYRGDVITLTEALMGFHAGGQIMLSDGTYQRIYGRLHTIKLKEQPRTLRQQGSAGTTDCELVHRVTRQTCTLSLCAQTDMTTTSTQERFFVSY